MLLHVFAIHACQFKEKFRVSSPERSASCCSIWSLTLLKMYFLSSFLYLARIFQKRIHLLWNFVPIEAQYTHGKPSFFKRIWPSSMEVSSVHGRYLLRPDFIKFVGVRTVFGRIMIPDWKIFLQVRQFPVGLWDHEIAENRMLHLSAPFRIGVGQSLWHLHNNTLNPNFR